MEFNEILNKTNELNQKTKVIIEKVDFSDCENWKYDEELGEINNATRSFFQIKGLRKTTGDEQIQQPIIIQNEIGYLGIIRKKINNELHYLMQYKIEPGNINKIQISPTIQATKSNFTQKHGGRKPAYLDYFINASNYKIIVDQIQSEQSSRFLGKRNRNIVIEVNDDEQIEVLPNFDWMTLPQIKKLMRYDNLVNMDTRTVISCIPMQYEDLKESDFTDKALYKSMMTGCKTNLLPDIFQHINNLKMFNESTTEIVPLKELDEWSIKNGELVCNKPYNYKVVFCNIEIEGREVKRWCQPLFEANGIATFGLFTCVVDGVRMFLVKSREEIGCFDQVEIGPSIQREYIDESEKDAVDLLFDQKLLSKEGIMFDTLLSEEGGRFYQEQNRNLIINIEKDELDLPDGYFWCDYKTLNQLVQVNNVLNIQLRNLLSVLEF